MSVQLSVNIPVNSVFPGGVLSGTVNVVAPQALQPRSFGVLVKCVLSQHWQTSHEEEDLFQNSDDAFPSTHTVYEDHDLDTPLLSAFVPAGNFVSGATMQGQGSFPFFYQVPENCVPSLSSVGDNKIIYSCSPQIDNNSYGAVETPFNVLIPMPLAKWQTPSQLVVERKLEMVCCGCCWSNGFVKIKFGFAKTVVSLDTDAIAFRVEIDNEKGEKGIKSIKAMLFCNGKVKVGHVCDFTRIASEKVIPAGVAAGATGVVEGILDLNIKNPPSFSSSVLDVTYKVCMIATVDAALTADVNASFPFFVSHAIDHTQTFNPELMNSFVPMNSASPVMAPQFNEAPQPQFALAPPVFQN